MTIKNGLVLLYQHDTFYSAARDLVGAIEMDPMIFSAGDLADLIDEGRSWTLASAAGQIFCEWERMVESAEEQVPYQDVAFVSGHYDDVVFDLEGWGSPFGDARQRLDAYNAVLGDMRDDPLSIEPDGRFNGMPEKLKAAIAALERWRDKQDWTDREMDDAYDVIADRQRDMRDKVDETRMLMIAANLHAIADSLLLADPSGADELDDDIRQDLEEHDGETL